MASQKLEGVDLYSRGIGCSPRPQDLDADVHAGYSGEALVFGTPTV